MNISLRTDTYSRLAALSRTQAYIHERMRSSEAKLRESYFQFLYGLLLSTNQEIEQLTGHALADQDY